jgi:hypothetical protein
MIIIIISNSYRLQMRRVENQERLFYSSTTKMPKLDYYI